MTQVKCKICPFLDICENNILSTDGTSILVSIDELSCPVWKAAQSVLHLEERSNPAW